MYTIHLQQHVEDSSLRTAVTELCMQKNVASWEIPKLNEVVHGTIIELNGGFSSLPCLITRGTHTFYIANPAGDGVWEHVFRKLRFSPPAR